MRSRPVLTIPPFPKLTSLNLDFLFDRKIRISLLCTSLYFAGNLAEGVSKMRTPFQISAVPIEEFSSLLSQTDDELRLLGGRRIVVDEKPGYPCRVSLVDAELGEEVLLVPFEHHGVNSPYRASGPIFVRTNAATAKLDVNEVPEMLRFRLLSFRGYDSTGMMQLSEVVEGKELETDLWRFFDDPRIDYI